MEAIICYSLLAELLAHFWASRTACRYSETPLPLVLYIYILYIRTRLSLFRPTGSCQSQASALPAIRKNSTTYSNIVNAQDWDKWAVKLFVNDACTCCQRSGPAAGLAPVYLTHSIRRVSRQNSCSRSTSSLLRQMSSKQRTVLYTFGSQWCASVIKSNKEFNSSSRARWEVEENRKKW